VKRPSGLPIECPSCGSADLRWSNKPHFLNFLMALVFRDPLRCCRCGFRFYGRALTDAEYQQKFGRKSAGHRHGGGRKDSPAP
jgi:C4-type Zn-finger protein